MKIKVIILTLISAFVLPCLAAFSSPAAAEETAKEISLFSTIPATEQEYFALNAPTDVYCDDEVTAILEVTDGDTKSTRLIVYQNGRYQTATYDFAVAQLCRFGNYLITAKESRPYAIDLRTLECSSSPISNDVDIHCFAANENYFVTRSSTTGISIYKAAADENGVTLEKQGVNITGVTSSTDTKIALSENNRIFYFDNAAELTCTTFDDNGVSEPKSLGYTSNGAIYAMNADENYIYVLTANSLQKLNAADGEKLTEKQVVSVERSIEDLVSPRGMSLRGGNVLIAASACNKIVEFSSDGFEYTGFAITTTANAKNRLTAETADISVLGNTAAILNGDGLTLKSGDNYGDYRTIDLSAFGYTPNAVALGENYIAVWNISAKRLTFINRSDPEKTVTTENNAYTFVSYSNGYFYVIAYEEVYKIPESYVAEKEAENGKVNINDFKNDVLVTLPNFSSGDMLAADIDGNIFIYSPVASNKNVLKYTKKSDGTYSANAEAFAFTEKPLKIGADLNGNVYALLSNNAIEYYKDGVKTAAKLKLSDNLPDTIAATGMAMSFDSKNVYFLFNGNGLVLATSEAENESITDIAVPENFRLTDTAAFDAEDLQIIKAKDGANVYEVSFEYGECFKYLKLGKADGKEYVYAGETAGFTVLAGDKLLLVKSGDVAETRVTPIAETKGGYTSTSVHLYYYPIVDAAATYALDGAARLEKGQKLIIGARVSVNGNEFYFAEAGGARGYLPKNMVTENLADEFERDKFTYEKIKASVNKPVKVYMYDDLEDEVASITADMTVYALKVDGKNVYYIEYKNTDGETATGYVSAANIVKKGKNAVRNALIICIVALSVAATSIYFVNRKHTKE